MTKRVFVTAIALALGAAACAPQEAAVDAAEGAAEVTAEETTRVDAADALESLYEADANYARVASARDLDGWMAVYAEDARMYPPESPEVTSLDAIRARLTGFTEDPNSSASFELLHAEVSPDGNLGYTMNLATTTGTGADGEVTRNRIRDFHVWRRQADGSWRIVIDMWAPAEPADST